MSVWEKYFFEIDVYWNFFKLSEGNESKNKRIQIIIVLVVSGLEIIVQFVMFFMKGFEEYIKVGLRFFC